MWCWRMKRSLRPCTKMRTRRRASSVCFDCDLSRRTHASVQRARARTEVRRWLNNYRELKQAIETICELNHELLRPERAASRGRGKRHD